MYIDLQGQNDIEPIKVCISNALELEEGKSASMKKINYEVRFYKMVKIPY